MESDIEAYLVKKIKNINGLCYKWTAPGIRGVPDRIILIEGQIRFVELKAKGKTPRKDQQYQIKQIERQGFKVDVIDTKEKVDDLILEIGGTT